MNAPAAAIAFVVGLGAIVAIGWAVLASFTRFDG